MGGGDVPFRLQRVWGQLQTISLHPRSWKTQAKEAVTVAHPGLAVVTGAFGYTGSYVAQRVIDKGVA